MSKHRWSLNLQESRLHVRVAGPGQHAPGQALNHGRPQDFSLTIANTMVKPLHQITLLLAVTTKLSPLTLQDVCPHNELIFQRILLDPAKLKDWLKIWQHYLMATLSYTMRKALLAWAIWRDMAKTFHVKLTTLWCCINGHKYTGGSKKKPAQQKITPPPTIHLIRLLKSDISTASSLHPFTRSSVAEIGSIKTGIFHPCSAVTTCSCLTHLPLSKLWPWLVSIQSLVIGRTTRPHALFWYPTQN